MLVEIPEEDGFDDRLIFSDETNLHVRGKVNKYHTGIWGTGNPIPLR